ncbi:hypothetical protein [Candidatus Cytomitobacter primus]|uniref:Uncharacterized protein n=1 Tax=Candidatus Cytomitobacter primus TaxID=2066024 RepID=A0A5C0UFS5_9PROT|nr:hypothetical protein [Candidatus Cytomitobacter primus]QEK38570.1 hypothetical protein FZC34_01435 [Candidatus Cytomitobacter primus]
MSINLPLGFQLIINNNIIEYANANKLENNTVFISEDALKNHNNLEVYFAFNRFSKSELLFISIISIHKLLSNINIKCELIWPNKLVIQNKIIAQCNTQSVNSMQIVKIKIKSIISNKHILIKLCEQMNFKLHQISMIGKHYIINQIQALIRQKKKEYENIPFLIQNIDKNGDLQIVSSDYTKHKLKLDDFICNT